MVNSAVSGKWDEIIEESKTKEKQRFEAKKMSTLSGYRMTEGTGVVKRMIDEYEVLFMQLNVTTEQIEATVRAAVLANKTRTNLSSCNSNDPESFVIGSTRVYEVSSFPPDCAEYLAKIIKENSGKFANIFSSDAQTVLIALYFH